MIGFYSKFELVKMLFKGKDERADSETLRIIKKMKKSYLNLNDFEFMKIFPVELRQIRRGTFYLKQS